MIPRDYQRDTLNALWRAVRPKNEKKINPIIALPCGTGKGPLPSWLIKHYMNVKPDARFLSVTHVKELVEQNANKARAILPEWAHIGVYSAGLKERTIGRDVTLCSIQSVYKRAQEVGRIDLMFLDEAHLLSPRSETMYVKFISELREINPSMCVVGLTATPYRTDSGCLTNGKIFDEIIVDYTTGDNYLKLQDEGYLSPLEVPSPGDLGQVDLSKIKDNGSWKITAKEERDAEEAMMSANDRIVSDIIKFGQDRNRWLVFAQSVDHARKLSQMINDAGVKSACVYADIDKDLGQGYRDATIQNFRSGGYRCVTNRDVMTTGTDIPEVDMIVVARFIRSPGIWRQMLGRGTRPVYSSAYSMSDLEDKDTRLKAIAEGSKPDGCLVLDYGNNAARLGAMNEKPPEPKRRNKKGKKKTQDEEEEKERKRGQKELEQVSATTPLISYRSRVAEVSTKSELYCYLHWYRIKENSRRLKRGYPELSPGWVAHMYKDVFGVWPRGQAIKEDVYKFTHNNPPRIPGYVLELINKTKQEYREALNEE